MINIKTEKDIEIMKEGGAKLARVKEALKKYVAVGVSAADVEKMACELIEKEGAEASFKKVPGYRWATCVNVNDGVVHGIPHKHIIFKKGDVVSVDVGVYYKGFHTDTSFSVSLDADAKTEKFLEAGRKALAQAIKAARPGNRIYDISQVIEDVIVEGGYTPIEALIGHGVGRELHEEPQIPCYTSGRREDSPEIPKHAVFAIEVMYTMGEPDVYVDRSDGWTISTKDGKMSALFEETVAIMEDGPFVITK